MKQKIRNVTGVSVVIPALNEGLAIAQTVHACAAVLNSYEGGIPFEIIVVDDGSSDRTGAIAEEAGARVIRHPENVGYGRSLKDGIAAASYELIAITDADGTYPIEDLPKLLDQWALGFDMAVGARTGEHYRQSFGKDKLRKILRAMVEWTAGRKIPDINSGFRVFAKKDSMRFFRHLCDTFSFTTSITLAYMMNGFFVRYVQTDYHQRIGKTNVRLFKDSLRTLGYIMRQILYFDPLKIFILFAVCCLVMSFAGFVFSFLTQLGIGYYLGILGIMSALFMLALGLLAEQLRQLLLAGEGKHE